MTDAKPRRADGLFQDMVARIQTQSLPPGSRMPSVREAARNQGVSPSTVVAAYDRLQAHGWIVARPKRGYFVKETNTIISSVATAQQGVMPAPVDASALIRGMFGSRSADEDLRVRRLSPGMGTLPPDWLDPALLKRALREAMRDDDAALRYGDPAGNEQLRIALARRLTELSIRVAPKQIITTLGATHGLDVIARSLLRPGDAVLVDEPGWAVEFARLTRLGMRLLPVPRGVEGPDLEVMERLLHSHQPRLYVTVSVLHNPTGHSLSAASAHRILRLAEQHDLLIVEDDTYAYFGDDQSPRLAALDGLNRTFYVSGFSKMVAPDWRVGFVAAPNAFVDALIDTKMLSTMSVPTLFERAIDHLLERGLLRRHAERIRERLNGARIRATKLVQGARAHLVTPANGMFGWIHVGVDTTKLAEQMAKDGWLTAPGHLFHVDGRSSDLMRINFATCQDARFWQALARSRAALNG